MNQKHQKRIFDVTVGIPEWEKCSLNQKWNNNKCCRECKNPIKNCACKEYFVWNSSDFSCETDEYLKNYAYMKNLFNSSVITCDKVIDTSRTASSDSKKKKKTKYELDYHVLTIFYLLTTLAINCYYIKPQVRKNMLPY